MADIGRLIAYFDADTKGFDRGLGRVRDAIGRAVLDLQGLTKTSNAASSQLVGLSSKMGLAAGGAVLLAGALGGAVFGLAKLVKSAAEAGGELFDLSQKTSFTVRTLSALSNAADTTGSSIEAISASLVIFQKNMGAAQDETSKQGELFRKLKIDTVDQEQALRDAFTALAKYGDTQKGVEVSTKLFGRSGAAVLAIIKETNGNLDEAIKRYDDLGTLISDAAAKTSDQFNDALEDTTKQLSAITREIGTQLLPMATKALTTISNSLAENKGNWKSWGQFIVDQINGVIGGVEMLANAIRGLGILLSDFETNFSNAVAAARSLSGNAGQSRDYFAPWRPQGRGGGATQGNRVLPEFNLLNPTLGSRIGPDILTRVAPALGQTNFPRAKAPGDTTTAPGGRRGGGGRGGTPEDRQTFADLAQEWLRLDEEDRLKKLKELADKKNEILSRILVDETGGLQSLFRLQDSITGGGGFVDIGGDAYAKLQELIAQGAPSAEPLELQVEARERIRQTSQDLADNLTGIFADSIAAGFEEGGKRGLVTLAQGLLNVVEQVFLRKLSEGLANVLNSVAFGGTGGGGGILGKVINFGIGILGGAVGGGGLNLLSAGRSVGPLSTSGTPLLTGLIHRASGGSVYPGQPYLVGERGPEMFMPGQSGNIVPNGGAQTIIINVPVARGSTYTSPKSRRELAQQIASAVQGAL